MTAYELENIKRALMSPNKINIELAVIMAVGQGMTATELARLYAIDSVYKEEVMSGTKKYPFKRLEYILGDFKVKYRGCENGYKEHMQSISIRKNGDLFKRHFLKKDNPKYPYKADVFCQMIEGFLKESNVEYKP